MNTSTMSKFAVAAAVCAAMAILPSYADTNITENVKLTEDADWTSLGTVNIAADAGIHLNGHNLTVSGFTGAGSIYSSALPPGYAELEYLDSTGAQYINTGISPYSAAKVEADVAHNGGGYEALLCASAYNNDITVNAKVYGLWVWVYSGNRWAVMFNGTTYNSSATVANGTRCKLVAQWSDTARTLTVDGVSTLNETTKVNNPVSTNNGMYMPAWNAAGTVRNMGKFRFYSVKIYIPQNTLRRNYVPAKRLSDNVAGFYDMVSRAFFPSATETAFVEGPEVERSGGELRINVASGTFQNSTVAISNSVKVVKTGAGKYTTSKTQTYIGGTAVTGGNVAATVEHGFGAAGSAFSISNARVDIEGRNNTLKDYDVTIEDAGTAEVIQGAARITGGSGYEKSFLKSLTLSGDASIGVWQEDAFGLTHNTGSIQPFTLTLNGHTLTIQGNSRLCANLVTVSDEGTINVRRSAGTTNTQLYPRGTFNAPLVTLDIGANAKMYGDNGFVVSNLVFSGIGGSQSSTILGRYTPKVTSGLPTVTLGDATHHAPTLDLSGISSAIGGISFANDSAVTVYVGTRSIAVGNKLVSWSSDSAPDISVSFLLTGEGWTALEREIALVARGDGLYVKTTVAPTYATLDVANDEWQFFAADGTPYPDEWTGGVTSDMQVRFSSYEEYVAIKAKGVSPSMFIMTGFTMPEGLGEVDATVGMVYQFDEGIVIDVKGNSLKLPSGMMFGSKAFTVTSSVAGGEVLIDVPSGTSRNTSMALSDSLKVTKTGAGTFVSAKAQTYTGGTFVNGGRAQPPDPPSQDSFTYSWDQFKAFGTGDIVVSSNATFDIRANYAYRGIIMLNGGTLTSSGPYDMNSTGSAGSGIGALTADSTLDVVRRMVVGDEKDSFSCDLGGRVLDINLSHGDSHELRLRSALTNGIVRVHGTRVLEIYNALDMSTTTLELGSALKLYATLDLKDYIAAFNSPYIAGTGTMNVHGSFRPECDYFYACKMLDGSALDLSKRTTMFSTTTKSLASGWGPSGTISYANNATIKVKLGERKVRNGTKIVGWTAKPANNVKFVAAEGERRRSFAIKDDGLYVHSGCILIVK